MILYHRKLFEGIKSKKGSFPFSQKPPRILTYIIFLKSFRCSHFRRISVFLEIRFHSLPPDFLRNLFHQFQLRPLLFLGQLIADLAGCKTTLRA